MKNKKMYDVEVWTGVEWQKLNDDPIEAESKHEALLAWAQYVVDCVDPEYELETDLDDLRVIKIKWDDIWAD